MGLGSSGLPIPPPILFSIIPYPLKRLPLASTEIMKHFVFLIPLSEELALLEEKREAESEADLSTTTTTTSSAKVKSEQCVLTLAVSLHRPAVERGAGDHAA